MKNLSYLLALVFAVACAPKSNNQPAPVGGSAKAETKTESKTEYFSYRFNINGCDTKPRAALSTEQLCRNLQNPTLNGDNCGLEQRQEMFKEACPGQTWDPVAARKEMREKKGPHMNCFVVDGPVTLDELLAKKRYVVEHYVVDPVAAIPHDNFVAIVSQELKAGKFTVNIKIMTEYPNGKIIKEDSKSWQDQEPDSALQVDGRDPISRVTCWPSIH